MDKYLFKNEIIISTNLFILEQDWEVPIEWSFVIASSRKIRSISEFTTEEWVEFMKILKKIRKWMNDVLWIEDVYFFQNEDTEHSFHLWIFPRHKWMEKFWRKIESVRPIMKFAQKNMLDKENIENVKRAVIKMKEYFKK